MAKAKKRADGRYCAQIYLGRDENGKRQYKSVYAKSPAELKEKETAVRLQLGRGLDVLAQRDSFAAWADDWLRLKEREHITCRQMDNYRRAVKLWKEELQGYEIGQVRADDIERVLLTLADQGLSQRTVSLYRSAIRQILRRAVGRVIPANPAEQVELTAVGRKEEHRRALTAEEQQWIWDTPHRAQSAAVIMMLSGLRRGELAALTWADVDLEARTITVNKVMEYDSSGVPSLRHVTKTAAGGLHGGAAPGQSAGDSQRPRRRHDGFRLEKAVGLLYAASEREVRHPDPGGPGAAEVRQAGPQAAGQDDPEHHHALASAHLLHAAVSGRGGRGSGVRSDGTRRREHHSADLYAPGRYTQAEVR